MHVAVVYIPAGGSGRLKTLSEALARGFSGCGHRAELFDATMDPYRLASFDYVCIGTESSGAMGRLPERARALVRQAFGLEGKRAFAYVRKSGLRPGKLLCRLMSAMEGAGMRVSYSEVITDPVGAEMAARNAPVERN